MTEAIPEQKKRPIRVLILWNHHEIAPQVVDSSAGGETPETQGVDEQELLLAGRIEPVLPGTAALAAELAQILDEHGFEVSAFDLEDDPMRILDAITVARPALVFNLVEQFYGDATLHAHVAACLDLFGVPYTGSDALCLATCRDRVRTHLLLDSTGIPVPRFEVIRDLNVIPDTEDFRFPVTVTRAWDDPYESIEGPIAQRDDFIARSAVLFKEFDLPYLVEEHIDARRLHAIVMGNRALDVLPLVEHDHSDGARADAPWTLAQLDYETVDRVRQLARRAFQVLGCRDIAQIDFCLDQGNTPYVVDVRPMFDLGPDSVFRGASEHTADGYEGAVIELIKLTCERAELDAPEEEEEEEEEEELFEAPLAGPDELPIGSDEDEEWTDEEDEEDEDDEEDEEWSDEGDEDEDEEDEEDGDGGGDGGGDDDENRDEDGDGPRSGP
jgi:D-alanine-D-alanine ligase